LSTAFVFPGQGSQAVGMGRELYAASPAARTIFDQADMTLGFSISRLCCEGPEELLTATENAQPALLTVSSALLSALAGSADSAPFVLDHASFVAGHSLGEYSALVAAGALDFPTALRLVRRRGELMAAADEGTMAAIIGIDEEQLEAVCREASSAAAPVVIANYNSPGQLVISGAAAAVEQAMALAKQRGAKRALPLKVSAAFHSPLMRAAAGELADVVGTAAVADARVPLVSNVLAEPLAEAAAIRRELVAQVTAPVRWIASVRHMVDAGVDTFVEIGPGAVLTGLIRRIAPDARPINVSDIGSAQSFLKS
jgi:[acyl-carrier-protein] S-malonyltransferase